MARRRDDARYVGAIRATDLYLLSDPDASASARALRTCVEDGDTNEEAFAANRLLMLEIKDLPAISQVERIITANLKDIYSDWSAVLSPITCEEVDVLVEMYRTGPPKQIQDLLLLFALVAPPLSDSSWDWISALAEDPSFKSGGAAFEILYRADAERFGRALLQRAWSWRDTDDLWTNHYGSLALASASRALPFDRIAPSLAPWLILRANTMRGASAVDSETAAAIRDTLVPGSNLTVPDLGSEILVHEETRGTAPFAISVEARPDPNASPMEQFRDAFNLDKQRETRQRAVEVAVARIKDARDAGASLFLHELRSEDFAPLIAQTPDAIARWLVGADEQSEDFRRRVRLAEGFYLALCEALLAGQRPEGEVLWRALRTTFVTRFLGRGNVDQLTHMPFRVREAPESLRRELLDLRGTNTDEGLLNLAIAARINGMEAWLDAVIDEDMASGVVWRGQRAQKLRGFRASPQAPWSWPTGEAPDLRSVRVHSAWIWMRAEAFARHWWARYWDADSDEEAFAAWELLTRTADRRSKAWMRWPAHDHARRAHAELNAGDLVSASRKLEKGMDTQFLGRKIVQGIGPWGKA